MKVGLTTVMSLAVGDQLFSRLPLMVLLCVSSWVPNAVMAALVQLDIPAGYQIFFIAAVVVDGFRGTIISFLLFWALRPPENGVHPSQVYNHLVCAGGFND
mmetsp:Transcript_60278/g.160456  ORF Transcript_60278/g.160456 Transcript_60278/m.160456 type:complete len:101 (+) Transcript_60278:2385-2687(+)